MPIKQFDSTNSSVSKSVKKEVNGQQDLKRSRAEALDKKAKKSVIFFIINWFIQSGYHFRNKKQLSDTEILKLRKYKMFLKLVLAALIAFGFLMVISATIPLAFHSLNDSEKNISLYQAFKNPLVHVVVLAIGLFAYFVFQPPY